MVFSCTGSPSASREKSLRRSGDRRRAWLATVAVNRPFGTAITLNLDADLPGLVCVNQAGEVFRSDRPAQRVATVAGRLAWRHGRRGVHLQRRVEGHAKAAPGFVKRYSRA